MEKRTGGRVNEVAPGRQVLEPPIEVGKIGAPDVAAVDDAEREEDMRRQPCECRFELAGRAHPIERDAMHGQVGGESEIVRWDEHTSELPSRMRNTYAAFCLKKTKPGQN